MQWAKGTGRMRLQWKRAFHAFLFASVRMHPNCLMYCLNKRLSTYVLVVSVFFRANQYQYPHFFWANSRPWDSSVDNGHCQDEPTMEGTHMFHALLFSFWLQFWYTPFALCIATKRLSLFQLLSFFLLTNTSNHIFFMCIVLLISEVSVLDSLRYKSNSATWKEGL